MAQHRLIAGHSSRFHRLLTYLIVVRIASEDQECCEIYYRYVVRYRILVSTDLVHLVR